MIICRQKRLQKMGHFRTHPEAMRGKPYSWRYLFEPSVSDFEGH